MEDVSITDKRGILCWELSCASYREISIARCNIIVADEGNMKITGQFTSMEPMLEELSYGSMGCCRFSYSGIQTPCTCVVFGLASVNFEIFC